MMAAADCSETLPMFQRHGVTFTKTTNFPISISNSPFHCVLRINLSVAFLHRPLAGYVDTHAHYSSGCITASRHTPDTILILKLFHYRPGQARRVPG
jgi:hypothetical protein